MANILPLVNPHHCGDAADAARTPKYRQIADMLLARIERGKLKPGELLPSEAELAGVLPASLGTIQKALNHLASQGIVVREQGKGTFVIRARTPDRYLRHFRFLAEDGNTLLPVYMRMLSVDLTAERGPWARVLGKEDDYVHLRRVMNINGEFEVFSEIYLSGGRFGALAAMDLRELEGTSIRDLLSDRFNAPTLGVEQTFRCMTLPPRVCTEIGVPQGTVGIVWEIAGRSYRELPITFQRVYVPPVDRPFQVLDRFHDREQNE
ncbi:MAG: GntR family transcriptional regulator [Betaproteobacteria bacterium]|nr:GntR family transcriptional regulator [Betaproteobacteria bacterium]MDE2209319.1 GntR family transcriptional regulator [Betaproteobacteria bacterium]